MLGVISKIVTTFHGSSNLETDVENFYDLKCTDILGNPFDFASLRGKVVLVVNVASNCGLTKSNYTELQQIYSELKDKGFEIIAFPCAQFLNQEPETGAKILDFGKTRFGVTFQLMEKTKVNGQEAHPVYRFLRSKTDPSPIDWNFSKFLIDRTGSTIQRFGASVRPKEIEPEIIKLLDASS
ncbi:hypothetical protein CAOG_07214 [Capsaspora owczarzaki ATCC 30864]|nr:hypothetical protein CAOG_07214 [Capsaspora owczarzaki ATCC 30864]|eukprot:XP_004343073.1 hypothetical protein CAOG_07214 [Capsaspora owczarzaki ATCC 30864]